MEVNAKIGLESTLVRILKNKLEIIRPGKISLSQIKKVLPYINLFNNMKNFFWNIKETLFS